MGRTRVKLLRVAFQGEHGAFSEEAAASLVGPDAETVPCQQFSDVFETVAAKAADFAVIPIENTLHGSVHENYDLLLNHNLVIAGETQVRIVHNLIAAKRVALPAVQRVFSHPVALNQCLSFFKKHPRLEKSPFYDTAGSVKMLIESKLSGGAAIASATAAQYYGAHILKRSIEDDRRNYTRFFLLQRADDKRKVLTSFSAKEFKTSLVFTTRNQPGAIFRALGAFALRDLSLSKIESRPLRGKPWEYLFYLDFLGGMDTPAAKNAVAHLGELADFYRVLGSYPRKA